MKTVSDSLSGMIPPESIPVHSSLPSVVGLLADLVRINSVNPSYEGGQSESGVVNYLREYFASSSIETWQQEVFPGRPNLIARLPGQNSSRRLVFEAHSDTVSVGGMTIRPFDPVISDGCLYGRGSCDTKGGLAAMAYAATSLKRSGIVPPCDIWVVAAADEEFSFGGVRRLLEGLEAAAAVVAEPTKMRVAIASKGVLRWRIQCLGKAAHSSKPQTGVNAITNMARVILALEADSISLQSKTHSLLGCATLNVGVIEGGRQVNIVPDLCAIDLDRRLLPGETIPEVLAHYQSLLDPMFRAHFETPILEDEAFETSAETDIVRCALSVSRESALNQEPIGVPFGSDASKFSRAGIPSIICGPGSIDMAHGPVEYVELSQIEQAVDFYQRLMVAFV
jgi:acetylornithine deacetylase/succinyl-diaminopimelate desuccinylase family protein